MTSRLGIIRKPARASATSQWGVQAGVERAEPDGARVDQRTRASSSHAPSAGDRGRRRGWPTAASCSRRRRGSSPGALTLRLRPDTSTSVATSGRDARSGEAPSMAVEQYAVYGEQTQALLRSAELIVTGTALSPASR